MCKLNLLVILLMTLLSCDRSREQKVIPEKITKSREKLIKPIFLEYWSGMTKQEFDSVSKLLNKKGLVKFSRSGHEIYYDAGENEPRIDLFKMDFNLEFQESLIFDNDYRIKYKSEGVNDGIVLSFFTEDFYKSYAQKYNLDDNVYYYKKNKFYLENKYNINSSRELKNQDEIISLLTQDNGLGVVGGMFEYQFLFKERKVIEIDDKVIVFENGKVDKQFENYLLEVPKNKNYYINKKRTPMYIPLIIYMDKNLYYRKIEKENTLKEQEKFQKEMEVERDNNREKESLNEI